MKQTIFVVGIALLFIGSVTALNPESCDLLQQTLCTVTIAPILQSCKENKIFSKCYEDLSAQKECLHCTCKVFPQYCSEKTGEIAESGSTNPLSKDKTSKEDTHFIDVRKILLAAINCDPNLYEKCSSQIQKFTGECLMNENDKRPTLQCIQEKIKATECNTCLCKIYPSVCDKEQIDKAETDSSKPKSSTSNGKPNISDFIVGGLLQTGINSDKIKGLISEGGVTDGVTSLLKNQDIQNKVKELLNNKQITDQLSNLIRSNPEEVSKIAQNIADNKSASKIVQEMTENHIKQENEKKEVEKKKIEEEEKQKNKVECNKSLKNKCQVEFFKLMKKCPTQSSGQRACVYTQLSGHECEPCICTYVKNIC